MIGFVQSVQTIRKNTDNPAKQKQNGAFELEIHHAVSNRGIQLSQQTVRSHMASAPGRTGGGTSLARRTGCRKAEKRRGFMGFC